MKNKYYDPDLDKGVSVGLNGIASVIKSFLNINKKMAEKFTELSAPDVWKEIVGEFIDEKTDEVYQRNDILFVKIQSNCLKNDLINQRTELLKQIQDKLPRINKIFWK